MSESPVEADQPVAEYPIGENQIRVLGADDEAAAGREAIEGRHAVESSLGLGQTWKELFGQIMVEHIDGSRLVIVHLPDWILGRRRVTNLFYTDDLGFLLWE